MNQHIIGYGYIIAAAFLWGMIGPFSRLAFEEGLAPLEVAFWRAILAWLFFFIHAGCQKQIRIHHSDLPLVVLFGITGVTLFYGSYQVSVQLGGAALAAVLLYTAPAWVAVFSRLFFHEALTARKWVALSLTLAGVVGVSFGPGGEGLQFEWRAVSAGLLSGFCYSMYYVIGKYFSNRYSAPNLFLYLLPIGALGLFPWVDFSYKTPTAWFALFFIAALATYGAYYFYYRGIQRLEAARASIVAALEPVIAAAVAYVWWGERFSSLGYLGSLLIFASVALMMMEGVRPQRHSVISPPDQTGG